MAKKSNQFWASMPDECIAVIDPMLEEDKLSRYRYVRGLIYQDLLKSGRMEIKQVPLNDRFVVEWLAGG